MTEIPGTGKVTPLAKRKKAKEKEAHVEKLSTVNVRRIHKLKKQPKLEPEDKLWYNQLRYWVLFGSTIGIIFVPLALIVNWRFIFLIILGPLSGWVSWYVKMFSRKFGRHTDIYLKRH